MESARTVFKKFGTAFVRVRSSSFDEGSDSWLVKLVFGSRVERMAETKSRRGAAAVAAVVEGEEGLGRRGLAQQELKQAFDASLMQFEFDCILGLRICGLLIINNPFFFKMKVQLFFSCLVFILSVFSCFVLEGVC